VLEEPITCVAQLLLKSLKISHRFSMQILEQNAQLLEPWPDAVILCIYAKPPTLLSHVYLWIKIFNHDQIIQT
jgi:hypothetical protein